MGKIYDFGEEDFRSEIINDKDTNGSDVLIIERIEILPEYRSKRYGEVALKEIVRKFSSSVAIIAVKPFPLQLEPSPDKEMKQKKYGLLDKNSKTAFKSLCGFYKRCGFKNIKGISKEVMILNPA